MDCSVEEGYALFSVELVADRFSGPVGSAVTFSATEHGVRPALGLRLLDLTTAVLEAQEGETYGRYADSQVRFGGRGKALSFKLPLPTAREHHSESPPLSLDPLPLWVMALARQTRGGHIADGSTSGASPAVLLASACVDLRAEVARAWPGLFGQATSLAVAPTSGTPFRRCGLRLTPVSDGGCALTLECYLRVYAGSQRPLMGGELLLQPALLQPSRASEQAALTPAAATSVETQTEEPSQPSQPVLGAEIGAGDARQQAPVTATLPVGSSSPAWADVGPRAELSTERGRIQPRGVGPAPKTGAYFADEITLRGSGCGLPLHGAMPASTAAAVAPEAAGRSCTAGPEVSGSLPLVAELLRELWQIRSVS
eukprot:TRINITY_DN38834_c0_g1_i1.p1 TRINITY_DN38834_c0_g1~~TRINITY_DN38834_c0_g1_i1.p1  ORF type:complete len:399 (-),score=55.15 TRINITY_DN38834_c0_g1_i1:110-1219(-)